MKRLKRLFVSLKGHIDQVADEFENHEALAGAAIQDLEALAKTTRLHLHRVAKLSEHYQQQLQTQQEQARLWSERAIKVRPNDGPKALECVKRLRETQRHIAALEQHYQASSAQEAKIRDDLNTIQAQLQALQTKKEILAARQNRTHVQDALLNTSATPLQEAQTIFDRWEGSVVSSEFDVPDRIEIDPLASAFEQEEEELALKRMLDELTEQTPSADKP